MTSAARPTWNSAIGGRSIRDQPSHPIQQKQVRDLPQQLNLKRRQTGQGSAAELALLSPAEFRKRLRSKEQALPGEEEESSSLAGGTQRLKQEWVQELVGSVQEEVEQLKKLAASGHAETGDEQNLVELRRKALAQAAAVDADESNDDSDASSSSDEDSDEDSDEESDTEELMRELERIKRERQLEKEKQEREQTEQEQKLREEEILVSNPLLAAGADFRVQRRWDDDVVFKNQAKGLQEKPEKRFINDMLRSDFHKKFMSKYIQ